MQLRLKDSLPFVNLTVGYHGETIQITEILVDTGSASTILAADRFLGSTTTGLSSRESWANSFYEGKQMMAGWQRHCWCTCTEKA